jgi:transposase InsO family protein
MWRASRLRIAVKSCHTKRIRAAHNCGFCGNRGLIGCTVYQDANGYGNSTQVLLSGPEASVQYSDLYQKPMPKGGPTGCTGISVNNSADSCRVYGCHISDFYTGISVAQGSVFSRCCRRWRVRDELLNTHTFLDIQDARQRAEHWRKDYNEIRPHSSLGYRTPKEFARVFSIIPRSQL